MVSIKRHMKKVILFDLDDTLYDYATVHKKASEAIFKKFRKSVKISKKDFDEKFSASRNEIHRELSGTASGHNRVLYIQRLIEKTHGTVEPKVILDLYDAYWDTLLNKSKLNPGVIKTLKEIKKRGFKIGIVTDLTSHIQLRKIHSLGLTNYVDGLVSSEEAGREKPHPSPFLLLLNKLDAKPSEAIHVGDSPKKDVEGANSLGITSIHLDIGNSDKKIKANYKIKEISELLKIIEELSKN